MFSQKVASRVCTSMISSSDHYPRRELFTLLKNANYDCYTLAEVAESKELGRFLRGFWVRM